MTAVNTSRIALVALAYAALMVVVGLWPFNFQTRCNECLNGAKAADPGFRFESAGVVVDEGAGPPLYDRLVGASGITVVVDMESGGFFQQGPARIISLSRDASGRNFTIGQERDGLVFRLRTPETGVNGSKPATIARWTVWPGWRRVFAASYDGRVFRIYADGALAAERVLDAGGFEGWERDFTLLFGNETNGDRPWRGRLYEATVYNRALRAEEAAALSPGAAMPEEGLIYRLTARCGAGQGALSGSCRMPATYANDHDWRFLNPGVRAWSDYALNAALWAPLGALCAALAGAVRRGGRGGSGRGRALLALAAAAALALGVEAGQAPLFSRTSSLLDLIAALAGLGLAASVTAFRRSG